MVMVVIGDAAEKVEDRARTGNFSCTEGTVLDLHTKSNVVYGTLILKLILNLHEARNQYCLHCVPAIFWGSRFSILARFDFSRHQKI